MAYVDRQLQSGEQVLVRRRAHAAAFAGTASFVGFVAMVVWLILRNNEDLPQSTAVRVVVGGAVLAAIAVVLRWARWRGAETAVTDRRLIACRDAWRRREVRIALPDLDVEVQQSTLGRLLGYGTLRLAGARGEQVTVTYVPTPDRFRDIAARQGPRGGRRSG